MIQRIQTLYLAFAALVLVFFGIAGRVVPQPGAYPWLTWASLGLALVAAVVAVVALFQYADRTRQLRLVTYVQWVLLLLLALLVATYFLVDGQNERLFENIVSLRLGSLVLAYVFVRLAAGAIRRDIALVRSMDRLR